MKLFGLIALTVAAGGLSVAGAAARPQPGGDRAAVARVLEDSAEAWSAGDLDRFMGCYEDSEATSYIKADGVVRGYRAIHDMYAARFTGASAMGKLLMNILDFRPLGPRYALVTGRFRLERPPAAGGEASGIFTLVFHKSAAGWRIVSDHTS
ncbi:MAG: SgcJ/EcaC family oxidoreductase [Caulobacteraceae bacterium]|nr:SgcJ/EcaC family oxidoreductase [Caulobacteraceae bacterium]